jgi:hypothetical protein
MYAFGDKPRSSLRIQQNHNSSLPKPKAATGKLIEDRIQHEKIVLKDPPYHQAGGGPISIAMGSPPMHESTAYPVLQTTRSAGVSHEEDDAMGGIGRKSSFAFDAISAFRTSAHPIPSRGGFLFYLGGVHHHDLGINSPSLMSASNSSSQSWGNL